MYSWADPGFQVRGGAIKKNCTERKEARIFFWVFRVKNHDFMQKNHIFSHFKGACAGCTPPWIRAWYCMYIVIQLQTFCGHIVMVLLSSSVDRMGSV